LECLALLTGVREYHVYLAGRPFTVYTDHVSLKYLQSLKVSANNRLARWALALQPYTFTINYKEGKKLTAADGVSRRPYTEPDVDKEDEEIDEDSYIAQIDADVFDAVTDRESIQSKPKRQWTLIDFHRDDDKDVPEYGEDTTNVCTINTADDMFGLQDVGTLQRQCPDFVPIFNYLEKGQLPEDDKEARKIVIEAEQFFIHDDVLYHILHPRTKGLDKLHPIVKQLCVPRRLREGLMIAYHDDNCHIGQERLYNTLKLKYWYPFMYTSTLAYVASCEVCQKTKTSTHRKKAPLKPLEVVEPFGRIQMDFVGPLPVTREGYRHLLVIVDSTSLWVEAFPTKSTTAEEVAQILYKEIIARFGIMRQILTDQGAGFRSKLIGELCRLLKIKQTFSSPYHPAGDGKCERMNQTVIKSLKLICDNQTEWVDRIVPVLMSYRASVTAVSGISPYYTLFGRQMNLGIDVVLLNEFEKAPDVQAYTRDLIPKLKLTHDIVKQNLENSNLRSKANYDKKSEEPAFELGSKVLLHDPTTKKNECPKLKKRWKGPYMITDKSDNGLLYKLRDCSSGKEVRSYIHSNRLKTFNENRDTFFTRHMIPRQYPSTESNNDSTNLDDGWYSIDKVTSRRRDKGKVSYLVHWSDGSRSREPEENISEFAKTQYFVALRQKRRRRRRT